MAGSSHAVTSVNPEIYALDDGDWHHVIVTIDDQSNVSVRLDNVAGSPPQSLGFPGFFWANAQEAVIGRYSAGKTPLFLDQFLIYDRVLSPGEQNALYNYDADQDGISNNDEIWWDRGPFRFDSDHDEDGLTTAQELTGIAGFNGTAVEFGPTNPLSKDTDGDGFDDQWEARYYAAGLVDPNDPLLPASEDDPLTVDIDESDLDGDGISNMESMLRGIDPLDRLNNDSDGDGFSDKDEVDRGSDPADPWSRPVMPGDLVGEPLAASFEPIGDLRPVDVENSNLRTEDEFLRPVDFEVSTFDHPDEGDISVNHERWRLWVGNQYIETTDHEDYNTRTKGSGELNLDRRLIHEVRLQGLGERPRTPYYNGDYAGYSYRFEMDSPLPYPLVYVDVDLGGWEYDDGKFWGLSLHNNDISLVTSRRGYIMPIPYVGFGWNYSGGEVLGPKYRKVGFNGRPLPDEKPQSEGESDQSSEESFVDAFDLRLNHDTTFHYSPLGASDLVIQARASVAETGHSDRSGLKPHERLDLPFGAGWSSNLCSYVEIVEVHGGSPDEPTSVTVVDETGSSQRFSTRDMQSFFPWPSSQTDKKTFLNSLTLEGDKFVLRKKFGNTLVFSKSKAWFTYASDRIQPDPEHSRKHQYWRLSEVVDRYGVRLVYDYNDPGMEANEVSLIPRRISCPDRPAQYLEIERSGDSRRVLALTNGMGQRISFEYSAGTLNYTGKDTKGRDVSVNLSGIPQLAFVHYPDHTKVGYLYGGTVERQMEYLVPTEKDPVPYDPAANAADDLLNYQLTDHYHVNVRSITDKKGRPSSFDYAIDESKTSYSGVVVKPHVRVDVSWLPEKAKLALLRTLKSKESLLTDQERGYFSINRVYGLPLRVKSISLPDGSGSQFQSTGKIQYEDVVKYLEPMTTTVTDAEGGKTVYSFEDESAEIVDVDQTITSISKHWMVYYRTMKIHHGAAEGSPGYLGSEEYEFDHTSGFCLKRAKDFSGNETKWEYSDAYDALPQGLSDSLQTMTRWSDPTSKTDALLRKESYAYSDHYRIMNSTNDVHGTVTSFGIDDLGRRISKRAVSPQGALLSEERFEYGNQRFKGFQTSSTKMAFGSSRGPWENNLKTLSIPDSQGRLWREVVDPQGENLISEHFYNLNNQKVATVDGRGNRIRFEYDNLNRLVKTIFPAAGTLAGAGVATKEIWYDFNGNKAAEIDEEGRYTIYHYDSFNRVVATIRDMDGIGLPEKNQDGLVSEAAKGMVTGNDLVTTCGYNAVGSVVWQKDPRGMVTRTFYDGIQRPIHVFTGLTELQATEGDLGTLSSDAAASNQITHTEFAYIDNGLALPGGGTVKANPGGSAFDSAGFKPTKMIRHNIALGHESAQPVSLTTYAVYDALYRPVRTEAEYRPGSFVVSTTEYGTLDGDKETLVTTTTDDRGKVTKTWMDGLKRPYLATDAFGTALASTSRTYYSSTGLAWKVIDPMGRVTETDFDSAGRPQAVWQPDPVSGLVNRSSPGNPLAGSPCVRTEYDRSGNVSATINPLGYRWEFGYDARNRKVLERQPAVAVTEVVSGNVQQSAAVSPTVTTSYDGLGNVISAKNARGHISRSFYDHANRVIEVRTNPVSGNPSDDAMEGGENDLRTLTEFDANGNATQVTDANGNITRNQYDRLNRLVATATNPNDGQPNAPPAAPAPGDIVVTNEYDDAGNLVKVTDGKGQVTGFRYDGFGRKTRTIWDEGSPVEKIEESNYDGLVQISRKDPKGQVASFGYDALQRVKEVLYDGSPVDNRVLTYDLTGNLTEVAYPNETAGRRILRGAKQVFDHLGRIKEETSAGVGHVHTYDNAGNRRSTEYGSTGRTLVSTYDALNRLLTMTEGGGAVTSYGYDINGSVTRKILPNGMTALISFDASNRRLGESSRAGDGSLVSSFDYSQPAGGYPSGYDGVGNVLKIVEDYGRADVKDRVVTNSYDHAYRLARETVVETGETTVTTDYGYDAANNRTVKTVTGGTNPGTWTFEHGTTSDGYNSNQVKSVTKGASVTTFLYDANGNRSEKKSGGTTVQTYGYDSDNRLRSVVDSAKGTFTYTYDHRTRRVGRNESAAGGISTELSFAGGLSVQEYTSGSGTPTVELIRGSDYGGGIGGVLYTIRGGVPSYNTYNSRGDVVGKTDDAGAITWQASYEAFGTRTQEQGATEDRQKANTKDEDPTGLLNEGFRYRDLEFGIFITRDPAGFVDGPNVYTYVTQNPWTAFDPDGLAKLSEDSDSDEDIEEEIEENEEKIEEMEASYEKSEESAKKDGRVTRAEAGTLGKQRAAIASVSSRNAFLRDVMETRAEIGENGYGTYEAVSAIRKQFGGFNYSPDPDLMMQYFQPDGGFAQGREGLERSVVGEKFVEASLSVSVPMPAASVVKLGRVAQESLIATKAPLVIGENMPGRVIPFAEKNGFEFFKPSPGQTNAETLIENFKVIEKAKSEGRQIIDIGPDWSRRAAEGGKGRSGYEMERWQLDGYKNYTKEFSRPKKK